MWLVKQDLAQVQWQMDGSHGNTSDTIKGRCHCEFAIFSWFLLTAKMQFNSKSQSPFKSHKCQNILLHPFAAKNINECCMWRKVKKRKRTLYQYSTSRCQTDWRPSSGAWPLCLLLASSHWWRLTKLIKQFQHVSTCLIKQLWQSRARYASTILSMCSNFCSFLLYLYLPYFRCKNKSAISSSWNLSACQHQPFAKQENHGETIDNLNRALAQPGKFALAQL